MKLAKLLLVILSVMHIGSAQDIYNRAKAALAAKDTAGAITAFQDALKQGQKTGETNFYLGSIAYRQDRFDDAIGFLLNAVRIDDENVDALIILGDAYIAKKDNANAIVQYKRAIKLAPKDCRVPLAYGAALVEANLLDGPDGAIVQLTKAKECDPNNPNVYILLGDAYNKQGVRPFANTNYQKALELSPMDYETQMKIARTYFANRQYKEAVEAFTSAVRIDSTRFSPYFEAGKILYRAKLWKLAVPFLSRATNLKPDHVEAVSIYAQSLANAEIWNEAAKMSAQAVKLDAASVDNWRAYAYALTETREYKGAVDAFNKLEAMKDMKPEDYAYLGKALFNAGEKQKAKDVLLKAVQIDSTNCESFGYLGFLYMDQKDYVNGAQMYEKRVACDPRSIISYVNAGSCYMQPPKNLTRAREMFVKAIELKPDYLNAKLWLARYYADNDVDSTEQMKRTYDDVIDIASKDPAKYKKELGEAYIQLGSYYFSKQKYPDAITTFRKAAAAGVDNAGLNLAWGMAIMQTLGDNPDERGAKTEDAVKKFRRTIQQEPGNAQGHFWLGNSLLMQRREGDSKFNKQLQEEACAEFVKALKLDPRMEDAKKSMERVGCK